jgi:phosphatidylinositol glycan class W
MKRSYKEQHEEFVSNHNGSSLFFLIICLSHIPLLILILKLVYKRLNIDSAFSVARFVFDSLFLLLPTLFLITVGAQYQHLSLFFLLIVAVIQWWFNKSANSTEMDSPSFDCTCYVTIFKGKDAFFYFYFIFSVSSLLLSSLFWFSLVGILNFLLSKGFNVALTCLVILAVDFPVFPRYYCKTETFGISLMDTGVGTFIISSAVTSRYARGIKLFTTLSSSTGKQNLHKFSQLSLGDRDPGNQTKKHQPFSGILYSFSAFLLQRCGISANRFLVLLLGFGRLFVIKALNYQEHVSEYGIHWNFFMTLFSVWIFSDLVHHFLPSRKLQFLLGLAILIIYQFFLSQQVLTDYLLGNKRTSFVDANKEGIFSLCGYIPLYLFSEIFSYYLFFHIEELPRLFCRTKSSSCNLIPCDEKKEKQEVIFLSSTTSASPSTEQHGEQLQGNPKMLIYLISCSFLLWVLFSLSETYIQRTSRRMCNSSYVLLILALTFSFILALYLVDRLVEGHSHRSRDPKEHPEAEIRKDQSTISILTLFYMNKHSLYVFLFANILTGLINFSMETINTSTSFSIIVLILYNIAFSLFSWMIEYLVTKSSN